jgi:hypothetical protein
LRKGTGDSGNCRSDPRHRDQKQRAEIRQFRRNHQQTEGPPEAEKLLEKLEVEAPIIERVCWLIAHHHTYDRIEGTDYQILVEADFLVNAYEDALSPDAIAAFGKKIFRTKAGKYLLETMYSCAC